VLAAAALFWNSLVMAADAEFETGALIPVFHWAFTFVPALGAGLAARRRGSSTPLRLALGTGVVTVPLFAIGWSLFGSRDAFAAVVGNSLWNTLILGVAPLALAALVSKNIAWNREHAAA
jgi:hypothetical protein